MKYRCILMFGEPGCGKGTQGSALGRLPGFVHLSTGDMFRKLDPRSDLGREVRSYTDRGELVPDGLTIRLWSRHVRDMAASGAYRPEEDLLILDGIPRNVAQAREMAEMLDVVALIHLVAGDGEAIVQRMKQRALRDNR